ncbi:uncharacterized protein G2W53_011441 [Senna tora]|uniref:Uncharacterized protein n=1 Tax=Senna tora TaxID=362788 RepID=A0A835CF78_9FABA|nr:uncharacterized protein G2W53_011441 [Senna tora]
MVTEKGSVGCDTIRDCPLLRDGMFPSLNVTKNCRHKMVLFCVTARGHSGFAAIQIPFQVLWQNDPLQKKILFSVCDGTWPSQNSSDLGRRSVIPSQIYRRFI